MESLRKWLVEAYEFLHSPKMRSPLIAACCIMVSLLSIRIILSNVRSLEDSARPVVASAKKAPGAATAQCDHLSFDQGNLVKNSSNELSENDCSLNCYAWFQENDGLDGSCLWNGKEFHQHTANEAKRNLANMAPPQQGGGSWKYVNRTQTPNQPKPLFVLDSEPDFVGEVPTEVRRTRLGEAHTIDLPFVPSVWVGDRRRVRAKEGASSSQIIVTPIRKGVTGVVLLDQENRPHRKIIYDIQ